MAKAIPSIDVTGTNDLLSVAEEVHRSGESRLLRRGKKNLAIIAPVPPKPLRRRRKGKSFSAEDDAAFLSAAGSWKDFDLTKFLRDNELSRSSSRPPVAM
jgi:hypothetical protein